MMTTMLNDNQGLLDNDAAQRDSDEVRFDVETLSCARCGGFLVPSHCLDLESSWGDRWCQTLRCIQCGELIDSVILRNRLRSVGHVRGADQPPQRTGS